ncbi:MAG: protein kinase [Oligoflexia bacterium]|nr:protein kinase [Oligoflexia bacterium]
MLIKHSIKHSIKHYIDKFTYLHNNLKNKKSIFNLYFSDFILMLTIFVVLFLNTGFIESNITSLAFASSASSSPIQPPAQAPEGNLKKILREIFGEFHFFSQKESKSVVATKKVDLRISKTTTAIEEYNEARDEYLELLKKGTSSASSLKEREQALQKIEDIISKIVATRLSKKKIDQTSSEKDEDIPTCLDEKNSCLKNHPTEKMVMEIAKKLNSLGDKFPSVFGSSTLAEEDFLVLVYYIESVKARCLADAKKDGHPVYYQKERAFQTKNFKPFLSFQCNPNGEIIVHLDSKHYLKSLGRGAFKKATFSVLYPVQSMPETLLVKLTSKLAKAPSDHPDQKILASALQEERILRKVYGLPGLLGSKDIVYYSGRVKDKGKSVPKQAIFFEYYPQTMRELISTQQLVKSGTFPSSQSIKTADAVKIFKDLIAGLYELRTLKIVHRDIKPENIFLKQSSQGKFTAKLGDFGTSVELLTDPTQLSSFQGTLPYHAPEWVQDYYRLQKDKSHVSSVDRILGGDIYSLGISLYELLFVQRIPWLHNITSLKDLSSQFLNTSEVQERYDSYWNKTMAAIKAKSVSDERDKLKQIILQMCNPDPKGRPTLQDLKTAF